MKNIDSKIYNWVFNSFPVSREFINAYRVFYCLFLLILDPVIDFNWIATLPNSIYSPPISLLSFTENLPPLWFFKCLTYCANFTLFTLLFGIKIRTSSIVFTCCMLLGKNYESSFGKIGHDAIIYLIPLILSLIDWHKQENKEEENTPSWPLTLLCVLFGFSMFTAVFPKFITGWLNPSSKITYNYIQQYYYVYQWKGLLTEHFLTIQSHVFWKLVDYTTLTFELLVFTAIFNKRIFRYSLIACLFFHLNVILLLDINFLENIVLYALFINPKYIPETVKIFIKKWLNKLSNTTTYLGLFISVLGTYLITTFGSPIDIAQHIFYNNSVDQIRWIEISIMAISLVLVLGFLVRYKIKKVS